jgi:ribonucleoside-diphosphate reductase alpha chain
MGWADMLFELAIPYDSQEAVALAEQVMAFINQIGHDEDARLAKTRGHFPNWPRSIYKDGPPMRNSTVTTIAPTGSISIIAGTSSGIEPIFALAFRHVVKQPGGGERVLTFVNPIFEQMAKERGFWSEELMAEVARQGTCHGVKGVPPEVQRVFVTAHEIAPEWHIRTQAAFQKHTDNGVSKTINLPQEASPDDVASAYQLAYETGCLGITVFRDGCKGEQVLNVGTEKKEAEPSDEAPAIPKAPKPRPAVLTGTTYRKTTPVGTAYITVNANGEGKQQPFEVFINIAKAGSDTTALAEALGRLISLVLRLPSPLSAFERAQDIVVQLRGIGSGRATGFGPQRVMSLPDAVAQVLAEHVGLSGTEPLPGLPDLDNETHPLPILSGADLCPECGQATFVMEEGCKKCHACGFSEC